MGNSDSLLSTGRDVSRKNKISSAQNCQYPSAHVRPIVRGKSQAKVEFGAKIHCSMIDGITFLDELSWDPFNEGSHLMDYVEQYKKRFGCYPKDLLVDKIYSTRENRRKLKEKGINLIGKPLGRPSLAAQIVLSPGERNPIEGKFTHDSIQFWSS